ncbi:MAG: hypothetical protein IK138_03775 [Lachnospiraceae bacterium]|nr:hypothetical protein [Lachnospiraceae bacterium]
MKDGFLRFMVLLVIFTAGLFTISRTDVERLEFEDARMTARFFLNTVCRMGEVSKASFGVFENSLPGGYACSLSAKSSGEGVLFGDTLIRETVSKNELFELGIGDEVVIEIKNSERSFICTGRVNGVRRSVL